jgi:glycosyltransferase involved in cell wall biosynthesis
MKKWSGFRVHQDRDAVFRPVNGAKSSDSLGSVWVDGVQERRLPGRRSHESFTKAVARPPRDSRYDMVCLSHLRWDFVHQRPQHLLSRCAKVRRVFFVEEPIFGDGPARIEVSPREGGLQVAVPHLPAGLDPAGVIAEQRRLLDELIGAWEIQRYALWYYTPMALTFSDHLEPSVTIFDCMDELSAFAFAPRELLEHEAELLRRADLVFTGGHSLYEAKRHRHPRVHPFPSSVDFHHFGQARAGRDDPQDQAGIPHPRLGFFGVVDERMDLDLIAGLASKRPDWQIVILGPVVKIDEASLPTAPNLHYLGSKQYAELPAYVAHWDVALLPFAINASTRYISPTKTPEYLAAGKPAVSTPIHDVVRPYGERGLVRIANGVDEFVAAIEAALNEHQPPAETRRAWLERVDELLAQTSWDSTWADMDALIQEAIQAKMGATYARI